MQHPMIRHPFLPEGYQQARRPLLRGVGSEMAQGTDISSIQSQNGTVLATFYPCLGRRVGQGDMCQAREEDYPSNVEAISRGAES
jgi:hypothetical protein